MLMIAAALPLAHRSTVKYRMRNTTTTKPIRAHIWPPPAAATMLDSRFIVSPSRSDVLCMSVSWWGRQAGERPCNECANREGKGSACARLAHIPCLLRAGCALPLLRSCLEQSGMRRAQCEAVVNQGGAAAGQAGRTLAAHWSPRVCSTY